MAFLLPLMLRACNIASDPELPQVMAVPPLTSPATMMRSSELGEADELVAQVLELHQELDARRHDLEPCDAINTLFGKLVGICTRTISEAVTNQVPSPNPSFLYLKS